MSQEYLCSLPSAFSRLRPNTYGSCRQSTNVHDSNIEVFPHHQQHKPRWCEHRSLRLFDDSSQWCIYLKDGCIRFDVDRLAVDEDFYFLGFFLRFDCCGLFTDLNVTLKRRKSSYLLSHREWCLYHAAWFGSRQPIIVDIEHRSLFSSINDRSSRNKETFSLLFRKRNKEKATRLYNSLYILFAKIQKWCNEILSVDNLCDFESLVQSREVQWRFLPAYVEALAGWELDGQLEEQREVFETILPRWLPIGFGVGGGSTGLISVSPSISLRVCKYSCRTCSNCRRT